MLRRVSRTKEFPGLPNDNVGVATKAYSRLRGAVEAAKSGVVVNIGLWVMTRAVTGHAGNEEFSRTQVHGVVTEVVVEVGVL